MLLGGTFLFGCPVFSVHYHAEEQCCFWQPCAADNRSNSPVVSISKLCSLGKTSLVPSASPFLLRSSQLGFCQPMRGAARWYQLGQQDGFCWQAKAELLAQPAGNKAPFSPAIASVSPLGNAVSSGEMPFPHCTSSGSIAGPCGPQGCLWDRGRGEEGAPLPHECVWMCMLGGAQSLV